MFTTQKVSHEAAHHSERWELSCYTTSTIKKIIRVVLLLLLGGAIVCGALSYCHLLERPLLYGAAGVGFLSLVGLVLTFFEKMRPMSQDILFLGSGLSEDVQNACLEALQKLHSSRFQKIGICMSKGSESDLYFGAQDGHLRDLKFENYPNGSVLVIRMGGDKNISERITRTGYFESCVAAQNDRICAFVAAGHQHIEMSWKESNYLLRTKTFPRRIRTFISG